MPDRHTADYNDHPQHDPADHQRRCATGIAGNGGASFDVAGDVCTPTRTRAAWADSEGIGRGRYRTIRRELDPLVKNERLAQANRAWLAHRGVLLIHLVGCRSAGKTSLLEALVTAPDEHASIFALEGGRATSFDAERLSRVGCRALQINAGSGCHLDAMMVARGLLQLDPPRGSTVVVESAADLAGPGWHYLGERAQVFVMSVTDGDDKPLKYADVFRATDLLVVNKVDLLPYVDFDVERCVAHARSSRPDLPTVCMSTRTGEGLDAFATWLQSARGGSMASAGWR